MARGAVQFFKLTHPTYITDDQFEFRNPVSTASQLQLPGIECPICGRWASSNRLRVGVPAGAQPFGAEEFVTPAQWMLGREGWARLLGVSADELAPGAEVGPPIGQCTSGIAADVVHPMPGIIWVRQSVREALDHLAGVSFADVQLSGECDVHLAELVVHGRAWRRGSTTESLLLCHVCGRTGFQILEISQSTRRVGMAPTSSPWTTTQILSLLRSESRSCWTLIGSPT
jgi:hypothetical protein